MGKPPFDFFSTRALRPPLPGQSCAVEAVAVEECVEAVRGLRVEDESVRLIVVAQAAAVQVSRAHGAEGVVHGHHLGVVETTVEEVNLSAAAGQLMGEVEGGVGCEGDVADGGYHDFHLYAAPEGVLQCAADGACGHEVGIDDADNLFRAVYGRGVGSPDDARRFAGHAVYNGHFHGFVRRDGDIGIVLRPAYVLACLAVPCGEENALQVAYGVSLYAEVHVMPLSYLGQTVQIVVGYVHAACITYAAVNDHYLTMVAVEGVVYPRESDGVEFHQLDTSFADSFHVAVAQRTVVRPVAESVEHGAHLHTFSHLFGQ